jgi:hypothetical protein
MRPEDGKMHNMILISENEGNEEWHCPICGRRLLVNWESESKKTVLEIGDEYAVHSGGKDDLQMASSKSVDESALPEEFETFIDDARLAPWVKWLDDVDFESRWDNDV